MRTLALCIALSVVSLPALAAETAAPAVAQEGHGAHVTPASSAHVSVNVSEAWARPAAQGTNTAIYLTATGGTANDRIVSITTPVADRVEMHETVVNEQGVSRMVAAPDGFVVAAGETVKLAPGGKHVMVFALKQALTGGDKFPVTVTFEQAGKVELEAAVRTNAPTPPVAPANPDAEDHSAHEGMSHEGHH